MYILRSGAKFQPPSLEVGCNMARTVYKSGVRYRPVHHVSQNDVSMNCQARNANNVVVNISIVGHYSIQLSLKMTSRQAILTLFPSNGLSMGALQQPRVAEVLWTFRTYWRTLSSFIRRSKCLFLTYPLCEHPSSSSSLTSLWTLVIIVVTDLENHHSFEVWDLDRLPCFRVNVLMYFEMGQSFSHKDWKWSVTWRERYIEMEFAMTQFITFRKRCLGEHKVKECEQCRCEHFHRWALFY